MQPKTLNTTHLGVLEFDPRTGFYESVVDGLCDNPIRFSVHADDLGQLHRLEAFAAWFQINHTRFKVPLEYEIQNYDLVWDDLWDQILGADWVDRPAGFLAKYLTYDTISLCSGKLCVYVDTAGLHTDHTVCVTIGQDMAIECCEI